MHKRRSAVWNLGFARDLKFGFWGFSEVWSLMFGAFLSLPCLATAATFQEDFSNDPVTHGWQVFGNTNLFPWDATNQNLRVTWDSSQPNSYFHHPLGTILGRDDDFSLGFDVRFSDVAVGRSEERRVGKECRSRW